MTLDGSFIIVIAFGFIQWFLWFLANRSSAPPDRPVRVHRYIAAFAGSRTSWVDCQNFAVQMGFFCIPFLHLLLYWSLAIDHLPVTLLLAVLMALILHAGLYFYARIRLMAAEFLVLGFRELIAGEGENVVEYKPVCKHCGYQECVYNFAAMRTGGLPKDYHLALAVFPNLRTWVPVLSRKTADALRAAKVTGLILVPVGGSEPAGLYGLRSSHILPPIQGQSEDLPVLPFRTQNCEPDHGIEPLPRVFRSDLSYRRSDFHAMDFNYSYELYGNRTRRGTRFLVISQRVYRILAKTDSKLQWNCQPVHFVS